MKTPRKPRIDKEQSSNTVTTEKDNDSLQLIANCLGYLIVNGNPQVNKEQEKDKDKAEKVITLFHLGFPRNQIAKILRMTPNAINLHLFKQGISNKRPKKATTSKK